MQRRGRRSRLADVDCPSGKRPFTSFRAAQGSLARLNGPHEQDESAGRPYRCEECGAFHITRLSRSERDRLLAERIAAA